MNDTDDGFTLIELMVVVAILAVLIAITIPTYLGFRVRAQDARAKADLTHAAMAEEGFRLQTGSFTDIAADIDAIASSLDFSGAEWSVHLVVGDVDPGDHRRVLLYARSRGGQWFGMHLAESDVASGRYTCTGGAEADMTLAGCIGHDW
jgi:prepilin-type N-terminal cleavage/methylation domain-containing protein